MPCRRPPSLAGALLLGARPQALHPLPNAMFGNRACYLHSLTRLNFHDVSTTTLCRAPCLEQPCLVAHTQLQVTGARHTGGRPCAGRHRRRQAHLQRPGGAHAAHQGGAAACGAPATRSDGEEQLAPALPPASTSASGTRHMWFHYPRCRESDLMHKCPSCLSCRALKPHRRKPMHPLLMSCFRWQTVLLVTRTTCT
jgi:hypothetical protein